MRVSAGATTARDIVLRRDWAAYAGGARVTAATGNDDDGSRCGPSTAIDQDAGTTWITDAPAAVPGAKAVTIALPEAVDVSTFEIDPSPGCGVGYSAMLSGWRVEVSRDGQTFTSMASGAFARPDAFRRNVVTPAPRSGYGARFVRLVGLSSLDPRTPNHRCEWLWRSRIRRLRQPRRSRAGDLDHDRPRRAHECP